MGARVATVQKRSLECSEGKNVLSLRQRSTKEEKSTTRNANTVTQGLGASSLFCRSFFLIDRSSSFLRPGCPLCKTCKNFVTGCFVATRAQNRAESRKRLNQSPFGFELKVPAALPAACAPGRSLTCSHAGLLATWRGKVRSRLLHQAREGQESYGTRRWYAEGAIKRRPSLHASSLTLCACRYMRTLIQTY